MCQHKKWLRFNKAHPFERTLLPPNKIPEAINYLWDEQVYHWFSVLKFIVSENIKKSLGKNIIAE